MLKIALIGACGHAGQAIREAQAFGDVDFIAAAPGNPNVNMAGCMNLMTEIGGKAPAYYEDAHEMLRKTSPDVVIVDNFYGAHAPYSMEALAKGCHVYSEKPVAASLEELAALREAVQKAGTQFSAMLNYRYYGSFYRAWQLIQAGKIGEVRLLNGQKSYKFGASRPDFCRLRETYGGTIPWVGIHAIDWIAWLSGQKFRSVHACQSTVGNRGYGELEMTALAQYEMTNGVMASLTVDYFNPQNAPLHGDDRIRVVGTQGVLEVRGHSLTLINGEAEGLRTMSVAEDGAIFADFLAQVVGTGECRVRAEDAFIATEAALRAQRAADTAETVAF